MNTTSASMACPTEPTRLRCFPAKSLRKAQTSACSTAPSSRARKLVRAGGKACRPEKGLARGQWTKPMVARRVARKWRSSPAALGWHRNLIHGEWLPEFALQSRSGALLRPRLHFPIAQECGQEGTGFVREEPASPVFHSYSAKPPVPF